MEIVVCEPEENVTENLITDEDMKGLRGYKITEVDVIYSDIFSGTYDIDTTNKDHVHKDRKRIGDTGGKLKDRSKVKGIGKRRSK